LTSSIPDLEFLWFTVPKGRPGVEISTTSNSGFLRESAGDKTTNNSRFSNPRRTNNNDFVGNRKRRHGGIRIELFIDISNEIGQGNDLAVLREIRDRKRTMNVS
jgi:hypothetical protein